MYMAVKLSGNFPYLVAIRVNHLAQPRITGKMQRVLLEDITERSILDVFQDDVEAVLGAIEVDVSHYVRVVKLP